MFFCNNLGFMFAISFFELFIENISGSRKPNDSACGVEICASAAKRAQSRKDTGINPLLTNDVTAQTSIFKDELRRLSKKIIV